MELRHLRYFTTLAETLNFTRAAERAHVTQSTLSHQIKQMEEEVGEKLFDRVGKRVVLTECGEGFLPYANRALREVDQGLNLLKQDPNELSGVVRVGATHAFNLEFIPACAAKFLERHPAVKIIIEELTPDAIEDRLKSDKLDLGIASRPDTHSNLRFEPLYHEEMVLVVSDRHPMASRKRIRMVELHHQNLVMLPAIFAARQMLNECFSACGAEPVVVAEMNTIAPMLGLVLRTTVAAIIIKSVVPATRGLRVIPIENPTPMRTPGIIWRQEVDQTAPVRSFAAIVRRAALDSRSRSESSSIKKRSN